MRRQKQRNQRSNQANNQPNFSGQHFLHSKRLAEEIVEMGQLTTSDLVLDLGAGSGRLTEHLVKRAGTVWAVEYDQKWIKQLQAKFALYDHVRIIERDILQIHLPRTPFVIVSSIPYAITTAILRKVLQPQTQFQRGVFVIEKGAAMRFTADPVSRPELLTWRMWFQLQRGKTLPSHLFSPPPKVDSAVLRVTRRSRPWIKPSLQARFFSLAKYGLQYPRAPVDQALRGVFTLPQINHLLRNLELDRTTPICRLTEQQWSVVFHTMYQKVPPFRWPR